VPLVLVGGFGPIARIGLRILLEESGFDVVQSESEAAELVRLAARMRPDAIVLDLDERCSLRTAGQLAALDPAVPVVVCSGVEPVMVVFPAASGDSYESPLDSARLRRALRR
jgi:DNA-binding NarL/FixJ family response regulator